MAAKKNKKTSRSARKGGGGRKKSKAKKNKKVTSRSKARKTTAKKVTSRSKARKASAKKTTSRHRKDPARVAAGKRTAAIMRARREGKAAFANLSPAEKARLRHAKKARHHARSAPHAHHAVQRPGMNPELKARLLAKYGSPQAHAAAAEAAEMARFA